MDVTAAKFRVAEDTLERLKNEHAAAPQKPLYADAFLLSCIRDLQAEKKRLLETVRQAYTHFYHLDRCGSLTREEEPILEALRSALDMEGK